MSIHPWCQRAYIRCIPINLFGKKGAMMQKVFVSHAKTKIDKMVVYNASGSWCGTDVDGMKKVMKKRRRSKIKKLTEKEILCKVAGCEIQKGLQITPCA
jgi:hypothetical protein